MARKSRLDLDADALDTEPATTIWIDSNGGQAGGEVYAVAEINGVAASKLTLQHGHCFLL
jgi:hypothetical protein